MSLDHWTNHYGKFSEHNVPIFVKTKEFFDSNIINNIEPKELKPPWENFQLYTDSSLHEIVSKKDNLCKITAHTHEFIDTKSHCFAIYTDGSKNKDLVGAAFYVSESKVSKCFRLTNGTQVYTAELCAIREALKFLVETKNSHEIHGKDIIIYSDSLSSVVALANIKRQEQSVLLQDIVEITQKIDNKVTVTWIPGHANIKGNEIADCLAKSALCHSDIDISIENDKSIYYKIEEYIIDMWQNCWNKNKTGSFYRQIEPKVSTNIKYKNKNRKVETIITRLRLGKCRLNKYLKDIKCHETGLCSTCVVVETIEHYLLQCIESNIKTKVMTECNKCNVPVTLIQILSKPQIIENCLELINRQL